MRNEISWPGHVFPSMQAARRECERRLSKYRHEDFLFPADREFFLSLFESRDPSFCEAFYGCEDPDLSDKPSLQYIHWERFSMRTPWRHYGLRAIREDGSWAPVSFRRATDQGGHRAYVLAAARCAVAAQVSGFMSDWKARNGSVSAVSGPTHEPLVHRYIGTYFGDLFCRWMRDEGLNFESISTQVYRRNCVSFVDEALTESWSNFHRQLAKMECVTCLEYHTAPDKESY